MPKIKPFCALKPSSFSKNKVVTRPMEHYSLGQARLIASENPFSFLHLINPVLDHHYLRGSRQDLIYKKVNDNLEHFLESQVLIAEQKPSLYIYQVKQDGCVQTGIWTLTHINDYLTGAVKKHENTVELREKLLADYIQHTALDANPVLLTYAPVKAIDALIQQYTFKIPDIDFMFDDETEHLIWTVAADQDIALLIAEFAKLPSVYIADGHHRIASMAKMAQQKSLLNTDMEAKSNYFSSAYFSTEQVRVLEFNRLVRDLNAYTENEFLSKIENNFKVEQVNHPVKATKMHEFGMYLLSGWYKLTAKSHLYDAKNPVSILDVTILQDFILSPLLGITNPKTDARIAFEGGKTSVAKLQEQVDAGHYKVVFTLFPITVQQIINVADENEIMPPKSTWIEPKFLVGLLTNHLGN